MMTYRELIEARDNGVEVWPILHPRLIQIKALKPYKVIDVAVESVEDCGRPNAVTVAAIQDADTPIFTEFCEQKHVYTSKCDAARAMLVTLRQSLPFYWEMCDQYDGIADLIQELSEIAKVEESEPSHEVAEHPGPFHQHANKIDPTM